MEKREVKTKSSQKTIREKKKRQISNSLIFQTEKLWETTSLIVLCKKYVHVKNINKRERDTRMLGTKVIALIYKELLQINKETTNIIIEKLDSLEQISLQKKT